jgi:hypothetical protein
MSAQFDALELSEFEDKINPLDQVEEILNAHNWVFHRASENELVVHVTGKSCNYRLFFIWQEDMNAMQYCCQYDMVIEDAAFENAARTLMSINENLWMGHFDLPKDTATPSFRYTCLMHGPEDAITAQLADIVDISLTQCERFYSAFNLLTHANENEDAANIELAMMETVGES